MSEPEKFISKHPKYSTNNPISKKLVGDFLTQLSSCLASVKFDSILDVGCGEGFFLFNNRNLVKGKTCYALDYDEVEVNDAKKNLPFCNVSTGDIYNLKFEDNSFDLVTCTEVMEHLEEPEKALKELKRVTKKNLIISVPNEPIWRILNMARGQFLSDLGNTPGHLNHWSSGKFKSFVSSEFKVKEKYTPLPWTIIVAEKR